VVVGYGIADYVGRSLEQGRHGTVDHEKLPSRPVAHGAPGVVLRQVYVEELNALVARW